MSSWSSVNTRASGRGDAPVGILAAFVSVASIAYVMKGDIEGYLGVAIVFTALIAVGEMLRIRLPNDRVAAPMASAFAVAYALIVQFGPLNLNPAQLLLQEQGHLALPLPSQWYSPALVVVVTTGGAAIGALCSAVVSQVRRVDGPVLQMEEVARRILTTFAVAVSFRPLAHSLIQSGYVVVGGNHQRNVYLLAILMLAAAVVGATVDVILVGLSRAFRQSSPFDRAIKDEFRESLPIGVPITSSAVLMALAAPWMGGWSLAVFAMPVLLSQFAFSRYARVVSTNESTIRALARVTELGGYTELQHADRVADLSRQIGLQLGLSSKRQLALERAALMHDIGQLSLAEAIPGGRVSPGTAFIPGGATILIPLEQQLDLARKGAAIILDTKFLDDVADIVERQVDPYRARGGVVDESVPLASRIIKVVNAYDDLVGGSLEADRRLQAVARIREGSGYEYDPVVVDVLSRIVTPRMSML